MDGYVLTVAIEKGGSGKTTTIWGLGEWFHRAGRKVLFVDMDSQGNLSTLLKADASKPTIYDVLTGTTGTWRAVQSTAYGDIIPFSPRMGELGSVLTSTGREYKLKEVLDRVKGQYDVVLIDTPPGIGIPSICALTASDGVIIPMKADILTLQGMESILGTVGSVKKYTNPELEILGILIADWDGRPALTKQIGELIEARAANVPTRVYGTKIRRGIAVQEAQAAKKGLFEYAPKSNPARDMDAFAKELDEQIGE